MEKTAQNIKQDNKPETQFTKEELFLIEKNMDKLAEDCVKGYAQIVHMIGKYAENNELAHETLTKLTKEHTYTFDMARTISAKCAILSGRNEK